MFSFICERLKKKKRTQSEHLLENWRDMGIKGVAMMGTKTVQSQG